MKKYHRPMMTSTQPLHTTPPTSRSITRRSWWGVAAALASLSFASVSAVAALPSRVFAPYIQVDSSTSFTSISSASGIKYFTLAFIIDDGSGHGLWEAGSTVASDSTLAPAIANLRAAGGDVIISFGGAAGNELAIGVTSASTLQSVYQGIINKYGVKALDFDIEGSALDNTAANDRRNQALAGLQAANPGLFISYTLPVNPTGLESNSIALLQNAKSHGVNVACVNIMAMDYGSSTTPSMGQDAIDATNNTISQLSANGLSTSIGITPLIGNQDTAPEVFTINDAQTVENFALGKSQVNRIAFWEVALDQCGSSCTGVSQSPWQFSHIFEPFSGTGTGTGNSITGSSGDGFHSVAMSSAQSGTFTATFDATPSLSPENAVIGLSHGAATAYGSISCIARFNPTGQIDAYSGSAYTAASTIYYSAGVTYHFRMVVNVPALTYSVYVTPAGGSELTVGTNLAFRSTAGAGTSLDTWDLDVNATPSGASLTANNLAVGSGSTLSLTGSSGDGFHSVAMSSAQSGSFTATFDAKPSLAPENAVIGLSQGAASAYGSIACIARFNPSGQIDAYNGSGYTAASAINYSAGVTYHFRMVINVPSLTYSVYVTPAGGSELTVGTNLAFRSTAGAVTSLDTWDLDVNATPAGATLTATSLTP